MVINKGSTANHTFPNGFILAGENIETISSLLRERYPDQSIIYRVTTNSSYIYQTSDFTEFFNEENSKANYIVKLEIILEGDDIDFILRFEKGERTFLKIEGTEKDKVYLLFNEVKAYVDKEITTAKRLQIPDHVKKAGASIIMIGLLLSMFIFIRSFLDDSSQRLQDAIQSTDVMDKLNYLLEERLYSSVRSGPMFHFLFIEIVILTFLTIGPWIISFLFGEKGIFIITDYFLIGKEKIAYEKKCKIRNNVIWTILIGSVVSIIAGLLVFLITSN